ncbi:MAG: DNA polymerase-4 [Lysobacterales bacterium]|jgi:DNA polymerase-4
MDAFYASVEVKDRPELEGKPVIVGGLGARGVVAAASYAARKHGVFSAMPMQRARSLCPDGVYIQPRASRYREASFEIFSLFREFTPMVEGLSLDEAFLDVSASLKAMGDIETIGRAVRDGIRRNTGLQASIGMAHNKFLAKLASDFKKPAGFYHVNPKRIYAFLDPLPIGRLWGIGNKTEPRLRALGVLTIGQLRKCEDEMLRTVLGNRTGHFKSLSRGEDEREVCTAREERSISHEITFDTDLREARELLAELQRQAEAVMRRVRRQHLVAKTINIKIRDHRFQTVTRSQSLRMATSSTRACFEVARALLKIWLQSHANTPVRLLGVGVSGLEESTEEAGQIDQTLDKIGDRYGDAVISRGLAFERKLKG